MNCCRWVARGLTRWGRRPQRMIERSKSLYSNHPEIEKDYDDNYWETREDEKWKKYPLIDEWEKNQIKWCNDREKKFDEETHLRKCPLCRK